ncbi:hypothetical protein P691DRAFT_763723 [Macrolepiota fuliginosa MF-IS2]|uniref:Uncharacterized protein n=1 Tax=Macrolepiota fuliginosa MF-IS2 TaxID=1400762 RepID=A0A9P5X4V9_9AGAR|nr:hypothetical protein P691DRAFT_763723 [Macrolepiota fuliginosa MF-IS2]
MGGGGDTAKTLNEIRADLRLQLGENARQKLRELGGNPGDNDDVNKTVPLIAAKCFKSAYGYEYTDNPIGSGVEVIGRRAPEFCNVVPPAASQVTCQIDTPEWVKEKAINDLYNHTRDIITGEGTDNKWLHSEYTRSYDIPQDTGARSVKCNSTLVYLYGDLLEDGIRTKIAFICFCGVYYMADSPTTQAQREIEQDAYKTAPPMPGDNPRQPKNQEELKTSLDETARKEFKEHFNYSLAPGSSYPSDARPGSTLFASDSILHYIPNLKPGDDPAYYIERLHNVLNIPVETVRRQAKKNAAAQYDTIIKASQGSDRSWVSDRFDKNFVAPDIDVSRIRQTGVLRCWYGHKSIDDGTTISVLYIYIMVMAYELGDSSKAQTRDLLNILGNQLCKEKELGSQDISYFELEKWVEDYARTEFQEKFGFEYNGESTIVPDKKPGGPVIAFSSLYQLKSFPAAEEEVQQWIWDSVLSKDHPIYGRDRIIDNIRNTVVKTLNDEVVKVNCWYTASVHQIFLDAESRGRDIQMYIYYMFVHVKLRVDLSPISVERLIVYALGVITSWVDPRRMTLAGVPAATLDAASAKVVKEYHYVLPQKARA